MHRAEVITVERRRRWSGTDKQQIVDETLVPGASISAVARRYGLHPSQVFAWRKAAREGDITELPSAPGRWIACLRQSS
jgi:transposase